jgi:hypothetical protein
MEKSQETEKINKKEEVIILTTKTVELLLSKSPDALSLYLFCIKNAKIQKTNCIFSVEKFGMKGLRWGRRRYRNAKNILIDKKFVEDVLRKNDKGKILGHYLKINYIFTKISTNDVLNSLTHRVETSTSGEQETNALNNTTINALSNTTKMQSSTNVDPITEKETTPFSFTVELNKLRDSTSRTNKLIYNYWKTKELVFQNKKQFDSAYKRELRPAKALDGYTSEQINRTFRYCQDNYSDIPWTLETVGKRIADVINKE